MGWLDAIGSAAKHLADSIPEAEAETGLCEYLIRLENVPGSMSACCEAIAEHGVNIVSGAGLGSEHAVAALVTDNSKATRAALDGIGANYTVDKLQTIELANEPGALAEFTRSLADDAVNLRSIYVLKTYEDIVEMGFTTD